MNLEQLEQKKELPSQGQFEISLNSEEDLRNLKNWLQNMIGKEEAEQCVFVLHSLAEEGFSNHCKDATQEFGKRLAEQFGNEESFFELVPSANYSDIRSYRPLTKTNYQADYHSVGLLEFNPTGKQPFSLIFDLTYGNISGKNKKNDTLIFHFSGDRKQAEEILKNYYGGLWKIDLEFDKKTGNFVFYEEPRRPNQLAA